MKCFDLEKNEMLCELTNRSLALPTLLAFSSLVDLPSFHFSFYAYRFYFAVEMYCDSYRPGEVRPIEACPYINFLQLFYLIWFMCIGLYGKITTNAFTSRILLEIEQWQTIEWKPTWIERIEPFLKHFLRSIFFSFSNLLEIKETIDKKYLKFELTTVSVSNFP